MNKEPQWVLYWDASAVLSALFKDSRSDEALLWTRKNAIHLISTLSYAEVSAVIARLKRQRILADILVDAAFEALERGPWRRLDIRPEWHEIKSMSLKWALRGADLWHLAVAKTLRPQLPELMVLTFDEKLRTAVEGEDLIRQDYQV